MRNTQKGFELPLFDKDNLTPKAKAFLDSFKMNDGDNGVTEPFDDGKAIEYMKRNRQYIERDADWLLSRLNLGLDKEMTNVHVDDRDTKDTTLR